MAESEWSLLDKHVAARVIHLQEGYLRNESAAVSQLARLRRGLDAPLGRDIELVGLTVADLYPSDQWHGDEPTPAEHAAYAAIVLYASHQQSHRDKRMHRKDYSFGRSARLLGRDSGAQDAVRRRFAALGTATSWNETLQHARSLIQQFRAHSIPLDYPRFARDLLSLQRPASAERVRTSWGRDFYRANHPDDAPPASDTEHAPSDD